MEANTRVALLEIEVNQLKYQLDATQKQKPRKRVHPDPNQRFAHIENIASAVDQLAAGQAKKRVKTTEKAASEAASRTEAAVTLQTMCVQWQL